MMPPVFTAEIETEAGLTALVTKVKSVLRPGSILLLHGEIGSGKTTFASHLMGLYGYHKAHSPTYSIINRYDISDRAEANVAAVTHVDLYRLESGDEIESAGFWDIFQDSFQIVIVEWAERVAEDAWPLGWLKFNLVIKKTPSGRNYFFAQTSETAF